jgi:hypothetical protein
MDLFTPITPLEKQHKYFIYMTESGTCQPEIEILKNWADGFIDRNGKFVKEFQTNFNSNFWELYLFACFKELGCQVNTSYETPDFLVSSQYGDFIAEAAIASHPEGFRPEWEKEDFSDLEKTSKKEILRLSAIRLEHSINKKFKKYRNHYSELSHVKNKPFVICATPFDQPFFFTQDSLAIAKVLYGYEGVISDTDSDGNLRIIGDSYNYQVQKNPGFDVHLGLFTNPKMKQVSAVIFNNRATFCKLRALAGDNDKCQIIFSGSRKIDSENEIRISPFFEQRPNYKETLLDGLHILLNPFAENPLDTRIFENREIAIHNYDKKTGEYISYLPHNFLLQRICYVIGSQNDLQEFKQHINKQYKELEPEQWKEGELKEFGGSSGHVRKNHMAHYKGWTIIVSLDSIDNDWGSIALKKLCYSVVEFTKENSKGNYKSLLLNDFRSTKEEAFNAMKKKIEDFKFLP